MILEALLVGMIQANCYILGDEHSREALIIDPGGDAPVILKALETRNLMAVGVLLTHGHFDHVEGLAKLKRATDARIYMHRADLPLIQGMASQGRFFGVRVEPAPTPDQFVQGGDEITCGGLRLKVLHTPGHSPGSISFQSDQGVFVGDLLFAGSIGRTDLQGGDYGTLIRSVRDTIFTLPDDTVVYPGHGPKTSVGTEKRTNPFFR